MAVRRKTVKRAVGPALYKVMEPGDQIIAGMLAVTGPSPWLDLLGAAAVIGLGAAGITGFFWVLVPNVLVPVLLFMRRNVFVAVTERQLICYRLTRMSNEPVRLLFCAPLPSVRVTDLGRSYPRWRSIRYDALGADGRSLRLNVQGRWRQDLDEVLAALYARGASVDGPPPAQALPFADDGRS